MILCAVPPHFVFKYLGIQHRPQHPDSFVIDARVVRELDGLASVTDPMLSQISAWCTAAKWETQEQDLPEEARDFIRDRLVQTLVLSLLIPRRWFLEQNTEVFTKNIGVWTRPLKPVIAKATFKIFRAIAAKIGDPAQETHFKLVRLALANIVGAYLPFFRIPEEPRTKG